MYVPPTTYSRDDNAVVSGGIGPCVSSLADSLSVQPSGVCVIAGGVDSTRPSSTGGGGVGAPSGGGGGNPSGGTGGASGGGASTATGSVSGSAQAGPRPRQPNNPQMAMTVMPRRSTYRTVTACPSIRRGM